MTAMQPLRALTFLPRLVLVWFVLSLGIAVAAPIVSPLKYEMICSGTSVKFIAQVDGEARDMGTKSMDCPLCTMSSAPPQDLSLDCIGKSPSLEYAMRSIPSARLASATASPLPPRGPPAST